MTSVVACKLPHGLQFTHNGRTVVLRGANSGETLEMPSRNGSPNDNATRTEAYGLTTLSDEDSKAFVEWQKAVTLDEGGKKLTEPFVAFENGAIQGPFKSIDDARKEAGAISGAVSTGFEGLDADKEAAKADGVKPDDKK